MTDDNLPSDDDLFHHAMRGVNPLKKEKKKSSAHLKTLAKPKPQPLKPSTPDANNTTPATEIHPEDLHEDEWVDADATIEFVRSGVQPKTVTSMKRGDIRIEAEIDLHRLNSSQATQQVSRFIDHSQQRGLRWIRIIHGKGNTQTNRSILKSVINQLLRRNEKVLAFRSCHQKDGGTGACYVLLKKA